MVKEELKKCFVISPIGDEGTKDRLRADKVLKYIIEPVSKECGYETVRADQISEPGIITSQITERLLHNDLVIADLTDHNPNVFYELAIRHCVGTPVIHLLKKGQRIPFDIHGFRTIHIPIDIENTKALENTKGELKKQVQSVEKRKRFVTPISQFPEILSSLIFTGLESFCSKGAVHDKSEMTAGSVVSFDEKILKEVSLYGTIAKTVDLSNKEVNRIDACLARIDKLTVSNSMVNLLDVSEAQIEELDISYAKINHLDASRSKITKLNRKGSRIIIEDTWRAKIGRQITQ